MISRALAASASLIQNVIVFLLFFYVILGIMGVQFFRGSLNRQCVVETRYPNGSFTDVVAFPLRSCGGYEDLNGTIRPPMNAEGIKGYICPIGQLCKVKDISSQRPNGIISYDTILASMFSIFQAASEQGWSNTMYNTMDAEYAVAAVYHVFCILIVSFVLINMLVAIIAETFANTQAEYRDRMSTEQRYDDLY